MGLYFCDNLILKKEALKMAYICRKTKQICPRVKYSVTGEASPDILFTLKGCNLLKLEEEIKNTVKANKENYVEKDEETEIEEKEETEKTEDVKTIEEKQNKDTEIKEDKRIEGINQKQSNYNKKKKKIKK